MTHTYTPDEDARIRAAIALPYRTKARTMAFLALSREIGISEAGVRARGRELEARDKGTSRLNHRDRKSRAKPQEAPKRRAVLPVIARPEWMGEPITMERLMARR